MTDDEPKKFVKKVCLVGDPEVGKTSLVRKYVLDSYDDAYIQTLGAKVMKKEVTIKPEKEVIYVTMMLWDVMGQKHFRIIESVAFEHVSSAFVVCDVTRRSTLDNISYWVKALTDISGDIPVIILANKSDLKDEAEFTEDDLKKIADEYNGVYFMTSAKTGNRVEEAFSKLAMMSIEGISK